MLKPDDYKKGRGAQINKANKFLKESIVREHVEGIDDWEIANSKTQYIPVFAKTLVNKVDSPDVGMEYSLNPYQGCEHGCIYCYARNSFEYWGYSAGTDFEQKILYKPDAPKLLRQFLDHPKWDGTPLSLSGNTDCYQPSERKFQLTRQLLSICQEYNQAVGIITKNAGILRDLDILVPMAEKRLVTVLLSVTTLDDSLRQVMEPRTVTGLQRLKVIEKLSVSGIHTGVMLGPMIPGLNEHEIPSILKSASEAGAVYAGYTFVRLNGAVKDLFRDWLFKNFPDKGDKVWHHIENGHGGKVNDSRFGTRMRGEGPIAELIRQQFKKYAKIYGLNQEDWQINTKEFRRPGGQLSLF